MSVKLLKLELKTEGKLLAVFFGILALVTFVTAVTWRLAGVGSVPTGDQQLMVDVMLLLCTLILIAVVVGVFIYLCYHFYRTMFSVEGYLTHTLPIPTMRIFRTKLLVSWMYLSLTMLVGLLMLLGLGFSISGHQFTVRDFFEVLKGFMDLMDYQYGTGRAILFCLLFCTTILVQLLNVLMLIYTAFAIGQLSNRHRLAAMIGAGVGLYLAHELLDLLIALAGGVPMNLMLGSVNNVHWEVTQLLGVQIAVEIFWFTVYYLICWRILTKHLNLE